MLKTFFKDWDFRDWWLVACLVLLIFGIFYSPFVASVARGLIIIGLFLCCVLWRKSFKGFSKKIIPVLCIASVFILDIVGTIWSNDLKQSWHIITHEVSFLTVPLFIALCSPLKKNVLTFIVGGYVFLCLLGTIVGCFNYVFTPYADVRHLIPGARNIAFALKTAFAIIILFIYTYTTKKYRKIIFPIIIWFLFFLIIMQMLSGLVTIILFAILELVYLAIKKRDRISIVLSCITLACLIGFGIWIYREYNNYFTIKEAFIGSNVKNASSEIRTDAQYMKTPNGNLYTGIDDNFVENGYLVNNYICPQEVESEWQKRTGLKLQDKCNDSIYSYEDLIYRYLNSKGMHKDAAAIRQLTDKDLDNLKHGLANVVYAERFSLKPRLYQTFFEFERFINTGSVEDKSLIQRFAMTKSAFNIINENLLIGIGTTDANKILKQQLSKDYPSLTVEDSDPHNQFIYIVVNFGILGLIAFLLLSSYPVIKLRLWKNRYFMAFIFICLCYMFAESSLRMMAGRIFFVMFFALLTFNNENIKKYYLSE